LKNVCFLIESAPRQPRRLAGSRISSCRIKLVAAEENHFGKITSPRRIRLYNNNLTWEPASAVPIIETLDQIEELFLLLFDLIWNQSKIQNFWTLI